MTDHRRNTEKHSDLMESWKVKMERIINTKE